MSRYWSWTALTFFRHVCFFKIFHGAIINQVGLISLLTYHLVIQFMLDPLLILYLKLLLKILNAVDDKTTPIYFNLTGLVKSCSAILPRASAAALSTVY
jgi:hypothetical protein